MQVNILEAKSQLSQLIRSVHAGEVVIIANRGEPVARLLPLPGLAAGAAPDRRPVTPAGPIPAARPGGILSWLEANPLPAYLQRSAQEIDAAIAEERSAWD